MQHWFAQSAPKRLPYRLYALSNAGSLLGLAVVSVPGGTVRRTRHDNAGHGPQGTGLFLGCYLFQRSNVRALAVVPEPTEIEIDSRIPWDKVGPNERALDGRFDCCGWVWRRVPPVLLLATTNLIPRNIAVSPFLWVLQLGLYLLSFIVCFESDRWYRREIFHPAFAVTVGFVIVVSLPSVIIPS